MFYRTGRCPRITSDNYRFSGTAYRQTCSKSNFKKGTVGYSSYS